MTTPSLSFEFFPPKTVEGSDRLMQVAEALNHKRPDYFSVTYGAGGSTRDSTLNAVTQLNQAGYTVAPHLSFGTDDQHRILELLQGYKEAGIRRLVALRGDLPSGVGAGIKLVYANELVAFIRQHTGDYFHIEVAAYPETHPQAKSYDEDIYYLKQKLDAGANGAITQYFYNPDAYFYFLERCQQAGISQPIVPGIMPITNYSNLLRFSEGCGAEIPRWIRKRLEGLKDDNESTQEFGIEVVTRLCEDLLAGGAPGLHFYTMNRSEPTLQICNNLSF